MREKTAAQIFDLIPHSEFELIVDISPDKINFNNLKIATDLEKITNGTVDCVICILNYENRNQVETFITKAKTLIKTDGYIVFGLTSAEDEDYLASIFRNCDLKIQTASLEKPIARPRFIYIKRENEREHIFVLRNFVKPAPHILIRKRENIIPCTQKTKACIVGKGDLLPECCYVHLQEMVLYLCQLFKESGIKYWIDFGTLLGAARDHKIIPWDDDGDIGITQKDIYKLFGLKATIHQRGYDLNTSICSNHSVARFFYSRVNKRYVDIYLWTDRVSFYECQGYKIDKESIQNLSEIELHQQMVSCPFNAENYLEKLYGADWRKPRNAFGLVDGIANKV